jgi:hypothetical protein
MIQSSDIQLDPKTLIKIKGMEEESIVWTEEEITKMELAKLPSKYIPQIAKDRNYIMSQFNLWSEYELYRFCQSTQTNMGETRKRATQE